MQYISSSTIEAWARVFMANFINNLTDFKSANLIGAIHQKGQTNLTVFSSVLHLGSDPALMGFVNSPITAAYATQLIDRYEYAKLGIKPEKRKKQTKEHASIKIEKY